jgi:hypothetical protein
MNKKVKNTNFENVYYYMGYYIMIDEKKHILYASKNILVGGYSGSKDFAIEKAINHIDKTNKEDKELYENIERKLCNLVKKDLANMVYNTVQHERGNGLTLKNKNYML